MMVVVKSTKITLWPHIGFNRTRDRDGDRWLMDNRQTQGRHKPIPTKDQLKITGPVVGQEEEDLLETL